MLIIFLKDDCFVKLNDGSTELFHSTHIWCMVYMTGSNTFYILVTANFVFDWYCTFELS